LLSHIFSKKQIVLSYRKRAAQTASRGLVVDKKSDKKRIGGREGDRTLGLRIANAALSQLSYSPDDV
jgi:hypothetical protein